MFEFKKRLKTQLPVELHNAMPHYSADEIFHRKNYEKKNKQQKKQKQKLHGKNKVYELERT